MVATGDTRNSFPPGQIGNMDERIVEGGVNVGDTEDVLSISNLRAEGDGGLFFWGLGLFWWLGKVDRLEQPMLENVDHG